MSEGYKSSENFCAVAEIWASNANKLYNGIAYVNYNVTTRETSG